MSKTKKAYLIFLSIICIFAVTGCSLGTLDNRIVQQEANQLPATDTARTGQNYSITDLGALPGGNVSIGQGINNLGQVAGTATGSAGTFAALFSNGTVTSLGTLGDSNMSFGHAINDSGQVVGYIWLNSGTPHAFLYSNGTMTDINAAALFPAGSVAVGINNADQVVGYGWVTTANMHAFLYSNGQTTDLGTLPGYDYSSTAIGINTAGQVVGPSSASSGISRGYLYSNGIMTNLGVPAGANSSTAADINSVGQILGTLTFDGESTSHAGLYSSGVWTDLGQLPGANGGTSAGAINDNGVVVGWAFFLPDYAAHKPFKWVGYVRQNGVLLDLNTLIPANSGYTITKAVGINNSGKIIANAKTSTSSSRALILTPD